jgi:FtsZ-binding cell division protein ZapB
VAKTLTIFLAADVSKLNRGLNQARGDMTGLSGTINNLLGPALIGAGIAAAGLAVKLGVDGVKAAIEDDAALQKLAQTLDNVGLAHDTAQIEEYIGALESSLGIADDQLRPAYDRLVRSIKDTEGANKALALALDISAGSGKSLDAVVQALGRAYDGNVSGLSRLGAGIDQAILKTGDMDAITASLAATFAGQATTSAQTFEGQTRRLSVAGDNLKEAFGTGLLKSLGDTNARTQDLVETFEDWEPVLEGLGGAVGTFATTTLDGLNKNLAVTDDNAAAAKDSLDGLNVAARVGGGFIAELGGAFGGANSPIGVFLRLLGMVDETAAAVPKALSATVQAAIDAGNAMKGAALATASFDDALSEISDKPSKAFYTVLGQLNKGAAESNYSLDRFDKTVQSTGRSATSTASTLKTLNTEIQETSPAYDAATQRVQLATDALDAETQALENATQKRKDYVNSLVGQITAGFDLGAGFAMKDGEVDGSAWVAGVEGQLAQTEWFGNVLEAVKRSDATNGEALAQYLAKQGIDKGAVWGQALLDQGLVPTMAAKLQQAVDSAALVATAMADPFTEAGDMAALNTIDALSKTLEDEKAALRQIGKNIGKPIGARIKEEIAQAVAEAIAAAAAARTAALAEVSAREAAQNAIAVEQATSQSIARLIRNSDNRAGRNVQPVLT